MPCSYRWKDTGIEAEVDLSSADLFEGLPVATICNPANVSALLCPSPQNPGDYPLGISLIDLVTVNSAVDHTNIHVPSVVQ